MKEVGGALIDEGTGEVMVSKMMLGAVMIEDMALDEEFLRLPSDLAYWNAQYTSANKTYLLEKHECRVTEARIRLIIREETLKDKPRPTGDDLKAMVYEDEEYQDAHKKYVLAEADKERLKKFAEAVAAKKDMLQSIGAKLRVELENDPVVRNQHSRSRSR